MNVFLHVCQQRVLCMVRCTPSKLWISTWQPSSRPSSRAALWFVVERYSAASFVSHACNRVSVVPFTELNFPLRSWTGPVTTWSLPSSPVCHTTPPSSTQKPSCPSFMWSNLRWDNLLLSFYRHMGSQF